MKRNIKYILGSLVAVLALCSACDMITYDGPYNTDGFFDGERSAYFLFEHEKDTLLNYSFSLRPAEETEYTFRVPISVVGTPSSTETKVGVAIVTEKTNAKEGVHFKPFNTEVIVPADSLKGYAEVTVLRKALPKEENTKVLLTLKLVDSPDYQVVGGERNEVTLSTDDYYDDTEIKEAWNNYYSGVLGLYNRAVYMKLLENFEWNEDNMWNNFWQPIFWIKWNDTVKYFEARPELGITIEMPEWAKGQLPYTE